MDDGLWVLFVLFLYAVALGLILLEIFLPSGGILGIVAMVIAGYCLYELYNHDQLWLAVIMVIFTLGYIVWAFRWGIRRMALHSTLESGVSTGADVKEAEGLLGETGVTVTPLRPAGVAKIANRRYDVVTNGTFVEAGDRVSVVDTSGNRIVVRPARDAESPAGTAETTS
ncbi:MAG: NfeD family protein [Planctomycetota bacterium]